MTRCRYFELPGGDLLCWAGRQWWSRVVGRRYDRANDYALPNSKVMIHQPHGQVGGQVSDIEIQADEIIKTREVLNKILSAIIADKPVEEIAKDTDRDKYLSAEESKAYGLVDDEMLAKPPVA